MELNKYTQPPFLIKVLEWVLGTICLGLIAQVYSGDTLWKQEVVHATYFGFFMITTLIILSYILDSPVKGILVMIISLCAGVLYITSAAINFQMYDKGMKEGRLVGAGVVALLNALVFFGDCVLSWRWDLV